MSLLQRIIVPRMNFFVYAVLALFWFGTAFLASYHLAMLAEGITHTM